MLHQQEEQELLPGFGSLLQITLSGRQLVELQTNHTNRLALLRQCITEEKLLIPAAPAIQILLL